MLLGFLTVSISMGLAVISFTSQPVAQAQQEQFKTLPTGLPITPTVAFSKLAKTISATDTVISVDNLANFSATGPFRVQINDEYIFVNQIVTGNFINCGRGWEGTVARGHNAGSLVIQVVTGGAIQQIAGNSFQNPMTASGDLIVGGSNGSPTRLPRGSNGQVVGVSGASLAYLNPLTNPMTTLGDLVVGGTGGTATRLAQGSDYQVLGVPFGGNTSFVTPPFIANTAYIDVTHPPGGLTALVGDNSTDNLARFNAIVSAAPTTGVTFYFPFGVYYFSGRVDLSRLRLCTLVGQGESIWAGTWGTVITGGATNDYLIYMNQNSQLQLYNINFAGNGANHVTSVYIQNTNNSCARDCEFGGYNGLWIDNNNFVFNGSNCNFSGSGASASANIGLAVSQSGGGMCFTGCNFTGWPNVAAEISGVEVSMIGCRAEVNGGGLVCGIDPNTGTAYSLSSSLISGWDFEANDTHLYVVNCNACTFNGLRGHGSSSAPSGHSQYGMRFNTTTQCDFHSMNWEGTYTHAVVYGPGYPDATACKDLDFSTITASNVGTGTGWVFEGVQVNNSDGINYDPTTYRSCILDDTPTGAILFESFQPRQLQNLDNGTRIDTRAMNTGQSWTVVNTGNSLQSINHLGTPNNPGVGSEVLLVADSGQTNVTGTMVVWLTGGAGPGAGPVVRYQDVSNYWLGDIESNLSSGNLKIIEKLAGAYNTKASATISGGGSGFKQPFQLSLSVNGSNLFTVTAIDPLNATTTSTTFTSSDFSTQTKCGLESFRATSGLYVQSYLLTSP